VQITTQHYFIKKTYINQCEKTQTQFTQPGAKPVMSQKTKENILKNAGVIYIYILGFASKIKVCVYVIYVCVVCIIILYIYKYTHVHVYI